ncbi:MAG: hypothetical protein EPO24_11560 [Bacteroidetes bacterium]|nr:MAG: hypothetical protein EPO24_11560 [Bacteroidota bacterium]
MKQIRPLDTTPEAYELQLQIFKKMTPEERLQQAIELTQTCRRLMATGVKMRHPDYNDEQTRLAVIRLQLGDELFIKAYPNAKDILP